MSRDGRRGWGTGEARGRSREVFGALAVTLALAHVIRAPCSSLDSWTRPGIGHRICYTDIVALWGDRKLDERFPYLDAGNEYPVGTGLLMGVLALPVEDERSYLWITEAVLALSALATAMILQRLVGKRALYFAAAPALATLGFLNWDLVAIALATAGLVYFLRDRDPPSGVLIGVGAAMKVFPALFLPALAFDRWRKGRRKAVGLAVAAGMGWLVLNVPIAIGFTFRWSLFFRFNAERSVDPATLWGLGCDEAGGGALCPSTAVLSLLWPIAFATVCVLAWRARSRAFPEAPSWPLGFAFMLAFLLTSKVYSPQYGLWLLPWFALVFPDIRWFLMQQAADAAAWVTSLLFVRAVPGSVTPPLWSVKLTVLLRAAALLGCLVAFVRRPVELVVTPGPSVVLSQSG